jgi:DNA-damage-inducible protein J
MTANAIVQTRVRQEIKDEAAIVLDSMGLTISDAMRMLLTRVAREKALPFEPFVPNAETIAAVMDARAGRTKKFDSVEVLMAELYADD